MRRADHSSRVVLTSVVCPTSVIAKPPTRKVMTPSRFEAIQKLKVCILNFTKFAMMRKFGHISNKSEV